AGPHTPLHCRIPSDASLSGACMPLLRRTGSRTLLLRTPPRRSLDGVDLPARGDHRATLTMTDQTTENIESISAALHGDKNTVLQYSLKNVRREVLENVLAELAIKHDLHEEITDLRKQMLQLTPAELQPDNPADRKDRLKIQDAYLTDTRELRALQLKIIDMNASLNREERELLARLLENEVRDRRLREFV
ncbi:MAG TPA: hypothetical protein VF215_09675, partial [Thermoanaerobaculia bacterium]